MSSKAFRQKQKLLKHQGSLQKQMSPHAYSEIAILRMPVQREVDILFESKLQLRRSKSAPCELREYTIL